MRIISSLLLAGWLTIGAAQAQIPQNPAAAPADTAKKYANPAGVPPPMKQPWYRGKLVRATAIPALLIGYGASTINGNGFYSSYDARNDIRRQFPNFHTKVDDYLILAPYAELALVELAGVEGRNDRLNTLLVILKSEAIFGLSTYVIKNTTKVLRPDGSTRNSFPSGHTAQAFLAASIVHTEFRDKSQWYGIGAYTIASSVGVLRMLNNRHWQSDVVAGAGLGILSAHLGYLSHRNRWGRKPLPGKYGFGPLLYPGATGLTVVWRP
ncbi:phosphatase PAP2 family protein [Hymenobacter jeollabukensis]|uniref:Phosphatase PAP2 family protein n=1 Tax=Hymenobacter jeollabukensis TaxID=2025313 RepID=A0A5R8WIG7_9BACT|nr:phosphatase PAP2 family protein [Hymenobacter jeollabukensis]TLM88386.1 phosphatase PAP2 family protein [Hymenobacter jeollabukensis]